MAKIKKYFRLDEVSKNIAELYEKGITRGVYLGFEGLHEYFTIKQSSTTYIYSQPFAGKSEFWFEIMMNLSEMYGYNHAIYSPESGDKSEIFAELVSKRVQKPFYKNVKGHMTEQERLTAEGFIREHFIIIDPEDADMSIEDFFALVVEIEAEYGIKIHTTCCDPFNELKHDMSDENGARDLYIENRLGLIRRDARKHKRHNCIITHASDQGQPITDGMTGTRYYPPATPRQIAGGQAWFRKAMNLICVWRPPVGVVDTKTNEVFLENEAHIIIQKYKPKGVGKKGMAKIYYDEFKNRYYEIINGERRYASSKRPVNPYQEQTKAPF